MVCFSSAIDTHESCRGTGRGFISETVRHSRAPHGCKRMKTTRAALWEIVKQNNSFPVKQNNNGNTKVRFSNDTNNICNLQSFKFSGG